MPFRILLVIFLCSLALHDVKAQSDKSIAEACKTFFQRNNGSENQFYIGALMTVESSPTFGGNFLYYASKKGRFARRRELSKIGFGASFLISPQFPYDAENNVLRTSTITGQLSWRATGMLHLIAGAGVKISDHEMPEGFTGLTIESRSEPIGDFGVLLNLASSTRVPVFLQFMVNTDLDFKVGLGLSF
ncbi:hypothetical protein [Aureibacter tunicatorum]|uniref:Uncharacterized protein n=1 Tax=Aureibacter tunicatorum TaxID=866807 RepID=A0AAE4BU97_9BACT|nr:hypothetical protein [Aureibacter tunicatorum]MDR6241571.1 hypothetical protein [Aureibacter tunicatorum]BDD07205.1 hypothetical protein AUTU_46880 [Aureibacter tunicatorum]